MSSSNTSVEPATSSQHPSSRFALPSHETPETTSTKSSISTLPQTLTPTMHALQPEGQFTFFGKLPPELRLMIWKHAANEPRVVSVQVILIPFRVGIYAMTPMNNFRSFVNAHGKLMKNTSSTPPPVILSVNKESREIGLKAYEKTFGAEDGIRAGKGDLCGRIEDASEFASKIYFDYNVDTLFLKFKQINLPGASLRWPLSSPHIPFAVLLGALVVDLIHGFSDRLRNLALELPDGSYPWLAEEQIVILDTAKALENVIFYREPSSGAPLDFGNFSEDLEEYPILDLPTFVRGYPVSNLTKLGSEHVTREKSDQKGAVKESIGEKGELEKEGAKENEG